MGSIRVAVPKHCQGSIEGSIDTVSEQNLSSIGQCKLVVDIKKWVDINKYEYVFIKLVHACWENWKYICIDNAGLLWGHYIVAVSAHDSFHLCLFNFPLIYQFHSIMTTLVRTTCWNPAELIIWKSFHHHFKRIWWGLLIEIEMELFLRSLLKYSEMSSQMITFNHFRCHLSYLSSYK